MSDTRSAEIYRQTLSKIRQAVANSERIGLEYWEKLATELVQIEHLSEVESRELVSTLQRDMGGVRTVVKDAGQAISDWLKFDAGVAEGILEDWIALVADDTWVDWFLLKKQWQQDSGLASGDLVGIGALRCTACGEHLTVHQPGHLPACPKCAGTEFTWDAAHSIAE